MKRMIALLLIAAMTISMTACGGSEKKEQMAAEAVTEEASEEISEEAIFIPYTELERAVWYGFVEEDVLETDLDGTIVTWEEYCDLLGRMIAIYDESAVTAWETMVAAAPSTKMKRDGAAIALLFAGKTMGLNYCNSNPSYGWNDEYDPGMNCSWDYPIFPWNEPVEPFDDNIEVYIPDNALFASWIYCHARVSCITTESLLDYKDGTPRYEDDFTLREAILSVVRLYESDTEVAMATADKLLALVEETPEAKEIVEAAEKRIEEILSTETTIVKGEEYIQGETYTGTAYYVSNGGDDGNDGLTPETAWATIDRVNQAKLSYGDAIFFERGSVWRGVELSGNIRNVEGITFSAYGEGEKPCLYGSPESAVGEEKWELYYSDESGKKIWKYYQDMVDCSALIIDEETIIKRQVAYFDGEKFKVIDDLETAFAVEEHLDDMELFCELPYTVLPAQGDTAMESMLGEAIYMTENGTFLEGALYLRCDEGNPGTLGETIEFIAAYTPFGGMANYTTVDNLHIGYSTSCVCSGYYDGKSADYIQIQNMEVGFSGGALNWFGERQNAAGFGHYHMDGGGINVNGSYVTVENCYSHHSFQEGLGYETFQGDPDPSVGITLKDNVVTYSVMGMILLNWEEDEESIHAMRDVLIENNYILYGGFETLYNNLVLTVEEENEETGSEINWPLRLGCLTLDTSLMRLRRGGENIKITNNTFAFSMSQMFHTQRFNEQEPIEFSDNVYAVLPGFAVRNNLVEDWGPFLKECNLEDTIRNILGDKTGTIVTYTP